MFINEMLKNKTTSFEIFPPKEEASYKTVAGAIDKMSALSPDFISVTYGANGGTCKNTVQIASDIQNKYNITALAHLTCVSSSKDEIKEIVTQLKQCNIKNILALRGDIQKGRELLNPKHYHFAYELILDIKKYNDFCIGAACYPEGHVESKNINDDIDYLQLKVDSGCDFLITQLFFDNNYFYSFMDRLIKKNITIPVLAGIMPITNANQIEKIIMLSNSKIPNNLKVIIEKYKDNPHDMLNAGIDYAKEQISDLIKNNVNGIHIYTMNKAQTAERIIK